MRKILFQILGFVFVSFLFLLFIMKLFDLSAEAGNQAITDFSEATTVDSEDTFLIVDDDDADTKNNQITWSNVKGAIVKTGTIATGVWNGTDIAVADGGTGASTLTDGGVLLGSGTGAVTPMAVLADGEIVVGDGTTDPVALAAFESSTGDLAVTAGGTGVGTLTDGGILLGSGTGDITALGVATNGQIPIGDGTTDPVLAVITGDNGITITNGAGTIAVVLNQVDISDSTNLTAGDDLTLTGDDLDVDAAVTRDTEWNGLDFLVGTATGTLSAEIVAGTAPAGDLEGTWGAPTIDNTGVALTSITIGALLGVDSIDATGAVDMDYGSADITDHTFTSDGGTVILDGSVTLTTGGNLVVGANTLTASDLLDGEQIGADTIDDDSIDFADVTGADLTLTDAGAITASGKIIGNASLDVKNGATTSGVLAIFEDSDAGTNKATFQVPSLAADTDYTLPPDDGDAGEQLQTDGAGVLTWESAGAGGAGGSTAIIETFNWPASSLSPTDSNDSYPALTLDTGTNADVLVLAYDDSDTESAGGAFMIPSYVDSDDTAVIKAVWYPATAATNSVIWSFNHIGRVEGENWDNALTEEEFAADAGDSVQDELTVSTFTDTMSNNGWVADDWCEFVFSRNADDGTAGDTLVGDANLLHLSVTFYHYP